MAYRDQISGLQANHHWDFDGDSVDQIGSANGTDTSIVYSSSAIAFDSTNCAEVDAVTDRISIPTTTDINNSAQTRKVVCGWFETTQIQLPFTRIYGEGNATTNFQFVMGMGNNITFEVRDGATWQVQVYSDFALASNRVYHILGVFEGDGFGNKVDLYIDGVKQTVTSSPSDRQPDDTDLALRGVGEFADPAGTVGLDGTSLLMVAPAQQGVSRFQHWATWDSFSLTDTQIRDVLFEQGCLEDDTISTGTEVAMQTALDAFSTTTRANAPCCIGVEAVTGSGDFTLDIDDITFDSLASIHVRYNGTADTLTLRNTNGSNCSIVSAPFGGTVNLVTEQTITVKAQDAIDFTNIEGARVLLLADTGGPLPAGDSVTITRSGSTATVTHADHGLVTGNDILISGADQIEYNGVQSITVTTGSAYTYTVSGTPTSPATGTIVATFVMIDEETIASGVASATFDYSSDQPVTGRIRKGSASTYYKISILSGTITTDGLDLISLMVPDE